MKTLNNGVAGDGGPHVTVNVQVIGLGARDVETDIGSGLGFGRWGEDSQVQIVQMRGPGILESCLIKVLAHHVELLEHAFAQNGFGVGRKPGTGSTSVGSVTKLNDSVTPVVRRFGVQTITLHQGDFGEIIG